ncbi:polysaccharide deacetylase family protein [Falsarthrobacter nasiphocae]|uniref:Peptidoglycan/xylan/chitin deacetylase (PgdA/CDA1 family) n=1 Tax=Falsarthrobacter nasiphocae TaxID=189863 RepID=A0AAE3YEM8_9MICC|nr:polysaccharide deacetylase family protein [Falsarthrobacter nasiphocae]MDR6891795.1 peptidoglycan/xylan/chitin deacetylase (PgdA/CDA1 family) [Falsarthrobacter nasiphocae]
MKRPPLARGHHSRRTALAAFGTLPLLVAGCAEGSDDDPRGPQPNPSGSPADGRTSAGPGAGPSPSGGPSANGEGTSGAPDPASPEGAWGAEARRKALAAAGSTAGRHWSTEPPGSLARFTPATGRERALTFDACGGDVLGVDHKLIAMLRREGVKATLFLNERWIGRHEGLVRELAEDPLFELAVHGTRHVPLSTSARAAYGITGTASAAEAWDEITGAARVLAGFGVRPRFMRPGTAFADEVCSRLALAARLPLASFSVNADAGATFTPAQVAETVVMAPAGSVLIAHMNRPGGGTAGGFTAAIPALKASGARFVTMSEAFPEHA